MQAVEGGSGTALLRATPYARRISARLPTDDAVTEVKGSYEVLRASVARVNLRPSMRVENVSVAVTYQSAPHTSSEAHKRRHECLQSPLSSLVLHLVSSKSIHTRALTF